jgi:hypothetical protein
VSQKNPRFGIWLMFPGFLAGKHRIWRALAARMHHLGSGTMPTWKWKWTWTWTGMTAGLAALCLVLPLAKGAVDEPCKLAKGDSPVAKACAEGGIPRAKQVMKEMVRQGRDAGVKLECDQCHQEPGHYEILTSDARDKFKRLQQAIEAKRKVSDR